MNSQLQYRQGDLLIVQVPEIPQQGEALSHRTLLDGGSGGHSHRLEEGALILGAEGLYVRLTQETALVHEEHARLELPTGEYQVIRQREYVPAPVRKFGPGAPRLKTLPVDGHRYVVD